MSNSSHPSIITWIALCAATFMGCNRPQPPQVVEDPLQDFAGGGVPDWLKPDVLDEPAIGEPRPVGEPLKPDPRFTRLEDGSFPYLTLRAQFEYPEPDGASFDVLAVSPDGRTAAVGGHSHHILLWDLQTGRIGLKLVDHEQDSAWSVESLAYSPDGKWLASFYAGGTKVWDASTGKLAKYLEGRGGKVAFSAGGKLLASSSGRLTTVWSFPDGNPLAKIEDEDAEYIHELMAFSPDGKTVAVARNNGKIAVYDVAAETLRHTLDGDSRDLNSLIFHPDGRLFSVGVDQQLKTWDVSTGELLQVCEEEGYFSWLTFAPGGEFFILAGDNSGFGEKLWDAETLKPIGWLTRIQSPYIAPAFTADGSTLVSLSNGGRILEVHDVRLSRPSVTITGEEIFPTLLAGDTFVVPRMTDGDQHVSEWRDSKTGDVRRSIKIDAGNYYYPVLSPDGARLAYLEQNPYRVRVRDLALGEITVEFELGNPDPEWIDNLDWVMFVGNDRLALVGDPVKFFDLRDGRVEDGTLDLPGGIMEIAATPNGETLLTGDSQGVIRAWDVAARKEIGSVLAHQGQVWWLDVSPDGKTLASGGETDPIVRTWNVPNLTEQHALLQGEEGRGIKAVSFGPDGKTLVVFASDRRVRVWDFDRGELLATHSWAPGFAGNAIASPDGTSFITGTKSELSVWTHDQLSTAEPTPKPPLPTAVRLASEPLAVPVLKSAVGGTEMSILNAVFDSAGRIAASDSPFGEEEVVHLWDVENGDLLRRFGPLESSYEFALSDDGSTVLGTGGESGDRHIKVWDTRTGKEKLVVRPADQTPQRSSLSADGGTLAFQFLDGFDDVIQVWDCERGEMRCQKNLGIVAVWVLQ